MKYISFAALVLSLFAIVISAWLAYFPTQPMCPPYTQIACAPVMISPGDLIPIWWPPLALAVWLVQISIHRKEKFGTSLLLALVLAIGLFFMRWGTSGFVRLW